jgi:YYY domain-containing protein
MAYSSPVKTSSSTLSTEKFSPLRMLWFLIPVLFAILFSSLLDEDQGSFLIWWVTLLAFGIAGFPITCYFFAAFRGKCYGFAKAIGILSSSFVLWTLCYLQIVEFTRSWICIFVALLFMLSWGLPSTRRAAISALSSSADVTEIAWQETLFVFALLFMCYLKGCRPEINGEEKFMDFAFINSLLRTDTLPAPDPWLAGYGINYYYYGQYIYAFIAKVTGIFSGVAYNLSMCTTFAFSFTMAYTLGFMFFDSAIRKGLRAPSSFRVLGGILSGFAVSVFGNSHAFFYDETSAGNKFLYFLKDLNVDVGRTTGFFYPDSTRFIGHNPDSFLRNDATGEIIALGDYTIHEFPYYSYLLGDLHAHVIGLLIVMLIVGLLFSLYDKSAPASAEERLMHAFPDVIDLMNFPDRLAYEIRHLLRPEIVAVGLLLGMATMCNYWDFLIYFIVGSMALLLYNTLTSAHFASLAGIPFFLLQIFMILIVYLQYSKSAYLLVGAQCIVMLISLAGATLLPTALTRTGAGMSFLFSMSSLCALTFNSRFDMIANSLAKTENQSPVYQFLILWGVHLIFAVLLIIITVMSRKDSVPKAKKTDSNMNAVASFIGTRWASDVYMSGIAVVAFLLLAAPEIFYVRDIYGGSYKRANTMFKFAFEAFVLLSLVMAYTFFRFLLVRKKSSYRWFGVVAGAVILSLLLCLPMRYPFISTEQRTGDLSEAEYIGLDGTAYLVNRDSPQIAISGADLTGYAAGISWLNEHVDGNPVICEAYGNSYTDSCLISAYTGLPTIMGWHTHEWLWHFQGIVNEKGELVADPAKPDVFVDIINPRQNDIRNIYTSSDAMAVQWILDKYDVTYLIVGDIERTLFPELNDEFIRSLGTVVFESGNFYIIEIA